MKGYLEVWYPQKPQETEKCENKLKLKESRMVWKKR